MNINTLKSSWVDNKSYHKEIHESFSDNVRNDSLLNKHRSWVTSNIWGFGEDSFHWFWKLLVDEMPKQFSFMEIGVFRGQILSLINVLSKFIGKEATVYGISPLDNSDGHWDSDYEKDVATIHKHFNVADKYTIYKGLSTDENIIQKAKKTSPYDIIYIDGSHQYEDVVSDFKYYAPMVKSGGYLVVDDCNNDLHMEFGFFQGIDAVTMAKIEYMQQYPNDWEFIFSVVHISVFRKK